MQDESPCKMNSRARSMNNNLSHRTKYLSPSPKHHSLKAASFACYSNLSGFMPPGPQWSSVVLNGHQCSSGCDIRIKVIPITPLRYPLPNMLYRDLPCRPMFPNRPIRVSCKSTMFLRSGSSSTPHFPKRPLCPTWTLYGPQIALKRCSAQIKVRRRGAPP